MKDDFILGLGFGMVIGFVFACTVVALVMFDDVRWLS